MDTLGGIGLLSVGWQLLPGFGDGVGNMASGLGGSSFLGEGDALLCGRGTEGSLSLSSGLVGNSPMALSSSIRRKSSSVPVRCTSSIGLSIFLKLKKIAGVENKLLFNGIFLLN